MNLATGKQGRLTLIRHGESIWNQQNRFTGWVDVSLSQNGVREAQRAGELLRDMKFDLAFSSALLRAQDTLYEVLKINRFCHQYLRIHETGREWYEHFTPAEGDLRELKVYLSERLNERYYGDLQGLNKDWARKRFGADQVHRWRRSYDERPPNGESLAMAAARVLPYFRSHVVPQLAKGQSVLISAHGNSLRAIVMHIEKIPPRQIASCEIPTGTPYVYTLDAQLHVQEKKVLQPS